ncbi:hypothetical protein [Fictibacillus solisalsi]|uniref:hypothetical protein n=1 Tax=Fictibacillus solisalsi TaxID=459525 RepID=UPI000B7F39AD|nr:hypothetical protein [Fictibacillus solisalsi]
MKKYLLLFIVCLVTVTCMASSVSAKGVNTKNSRMSFTVLDSKGKKYRIYIKASKESFKKGSYDKCSWNCPWAGVNKGDKLYKGNYKVYLKSGNKKPSYTKVHKNNYIYNKTKKMIYYIPSKYKGQPDLFGFAETGSSNFESITFYYVKNGKLSKIKKEFWYTKRPHIAGKNKYELASYNNDTGKWTIFTYSFNFSKGTTKKLINKSYSYAKGESIIKKWKISWEG